MFKDLGVFQGFPEPGEPLLEGFDLLGQGLLGPLDRLVTIKLGIRDHMASRPDEIGLSLVGELNNGLEGNHLASGLVEKAVGLSAGHLVQVAQGVNDPLLTLFGHALGLSDGSEDLAGVHGPLRRWDPLHGDFDGSPA